MSDNGQITVFLVHHHAAVRRGLRTLLGTDPGLTVTGEAGTAAEALARVPVLRPDVVLLDTRLPDGGGVEVCRGIRSRRPEVRFLILTSGSPDEALFEAAMAGAAGSVPRSVRRADLAGAVHRVAAGGTLLDRDAAVRMLRSLGGGTGPPGGLAEEDREILRHIGEGMTDRRIGDTMHLAERTVRSHVSGLLRTLGTRLRDRSLRAAAGVHGPGRRG